MVSVGVSVCVTMMLDEGRALDDNSNRRDE
jgi:hypothetical protein